MTTRGIRSELLDKASKRLKARAIHIFDGNTKHKYANVPIAIYLEDSRNQKHDFAKGIRLVFHIPLKEAEWRQAEKQITPDKLEIDIYLDEAEAKTHGFIFDGQIQQKISAWFSP